jgi:6-phosphofructo-2-kinase/fructose-2,6-biphosphatase 2
MSSRGTNGVGVQVEDTKICVVMVGLPARGKSYIAQKAQRYLQWLSIPAKTFNVGNYRRNDAPHPPADFFDTNNKEGEMKRRAAAEAAVKDMLDWFRSGGVIGILDATNSTKDRRKWVTDMFANHGVEVLFVESKCDDESLIMANIRDVKTTSPDYQGLDPEEAALDFRNRIRNYEKVYKTIDADGDESDYTYLKIMDVGKQVIINRIQDYLQSRVVYYLMNLHIRPRSVWLSRVSTTFQAIPLLPSHCTNLLSSTASRCTIWTEGLAETLFCRPGASNTRESCPTSCVSLSEMTDP